MEIKRGLPIGGQALPNGVMMRGPNKYAIALRLHSGRVVTESWLCSQKRMIEKPVLRGIYQLAVSFKVSFQTMRRAVKLTREAGELHISLFTILNAVAIIALLGLYALSSGWLYGYLDLSMAEFSKHYLFTFVYGMADLILFCLSMLIIMRLPAVKKLLKYHGAEHKAIACYEKGLELTTQNVRGQSRFHKRCGTSMVVTILIAGIITSVLIPPQLSEAAQTLIFGFVMLIAAGISYESMRSKKSTPVSRLVLKAQRITTLEPDDAMIECAIAAVLQATAS